MHGIHVDIENDVIGSIRSFSSNNFVDSSHMQDLIRSSWGRYSATCSTHSGYHFPKMVFLSSLSPFHTTYMILKPRDLTKVEAVVPLFDAESHSVGYNRFILPMRHIPTQGVWWNDPREYTASVVLDLLSPNYDTLPFHDEMDSFASRINLSCPPSRYLSCPPSRSHSNQITSSITNPEYQNVLFNTSTDVPKIFEDGEILWVVMIWNNIYSMDIADDMIRDVSNFSLNTLIINGNM